jgi:hypothetical protein
VHDPPDTTSEFQIVNDFTGAQSVAMNNDHNLVREVFEEYITNEMPIRLLYITEDRGRMKFQLVDRFFIKEHFKSVPKEIHEEFRYKRLVDREEAVREKVKERLKYAIFSHRWLSEEPLYRDVSKEPMEIPAPEPGWKKLQEFCRKAMYGHRCKFAWSDTCCIDKTSSAELDESIRSMFHWYRNAHICIALLSETADLRALHMSQTGQSGAEIDAWFLRGWTLQELLAPSQIKFYGANWEPLSSLNPSNDRFSRDIMHPISRITRIPPNDLESFSPGTNRVPEKMLWASQRRTTRIEDIAYCLIGIFDISLIIAYGEGKRAFFRLMEEILKRYDRWDIFRWSGRCSRYNAALPEGPDCYPAGYSGMHVAHQKDASDVEQQNNAKYDIGDRLFTLTNHGLRIKVLLLPVHLAHTRDDAGRSRYLTFGDVERCKVPKVKHIGAKLKDGTNWAIGILDYWVGDASGFMERHKQNSFTAFLLSYDEDAPDRDRKWKKEMTEEIIKIHSPDFVDRKLTQLYL